MCVCVCVGEGASRSLPSKGLFKRLVLNLPSSTLTAAWNFLLTHFQHHLSTLVSYTCLNSPLNTLRYQISKICNSTPSIMSISRVFRCCRCPRCLITVLLHLLVCSVLSLKCKASLNRGINTFLAFVASLFLFFPSFLCLCFCFTVSLFIRPFPRHQLTPIPFSPHCRTNKQCSRLRHEGWLSAQRVQLVSISRQGRKDDRERCWNESSVGAPSLFSLGYKSSHCEDGGRHVCSCPSKI